MDAPEMMQAARRAWRAQKGFLAWVADEKDRYPVLQKMD
jgi:hypothetical protein